MWFLSRGFPFLEFQLATTTCVSLLSSAIVRSCPIGPGKIPLLLLLYMLLWGTHTGQAPPSPSLLLFLRHNSPNPTKRDTRPKIYKRPLKKKISSPPSLHIRCPRIRRTSGHVKKMGCSFAKKNQFSSFNVALDLWLLPNPRDEVPSKSNPLLESWMRCCERI